jgi:Family of unknown function (DUF5681)
MYNDDGNGRDKYGRWKKGYCPNPKGRPRKEPDISDADVGWFKQRMVEATINGEKRWLTRHELLLHSMYEQAIKGKSVNITRKLFDRFEDVDMTWAKGRDWLREARAKFLDAYYEDGTIDEKLANEILDLQAMLAYGRKPKPLRKPRLKKPAGPPSWRKNPKPQFILDLEEEWAKAEAAEKAARSKKDDEPEKS